MWLLYIYAYHVHYKVLLHNQGGYYNSLILQALDLPPEAINQSYKSLFHACYEYVKCITTHSHSNTINLFQRTHRCVLQEILSHQNWAQVGDGQLINKFIPFFITNGFTIADTNQNYQASLNDVTRLYQVKTLFTSQTALSLS